MHHFRNKKLSVLFIIVLIIGLLTTAASPYAAEGNTHRVKHATNLLKGLSDAQRQGLKELEMTKGFTIHPDINQKSSELVNVIVAFKTAPAKVEMLKKQLKGKKIALSSAQNDAKSDHAVFKKFVKDHQGKAKSAGIGLQDAKITREYFDAFNGVAMKVRGTQVRELLQSGVVQTIYDDDSITLDPPQDAAKKKTNSSATDKAGEGVKQIDADKLHKENITGDGVKVAVVDTGIDYNHPDLKGIYKGGYDFVNNDDDPMETTYKEWKESHEPEFSNDGSPYYTYHGTHVSGIIGAQPNNPDLDIMGVAPDVDLYVYKVLGAYGSGEMSDIIAGVDRAVKDEMDVINLSLGANINDPHSPASIAVNNAMLSGTVVTVAAGNSGPGEKTLGTPGAAALPITVGAVDNTDTLASFSSKGPVEGSDEIKPDLVAPGVNVLSTVAGFLNDPDNPSNYKDAYERLSGTSMATPHTAGAAALILQAHPEYTPFEVKIALMNNTDEITEGFTSVHEIGAGRINVYDAVHAGAAWNVQDKTRNQQDEDMTEIDVETGSIGFGSYIVDDDEAVDDKSKIKLINHSKNKEKTFDSSVHFLPGKGSVQDAEKNRVKMNVDQKIEVPAGETVTLDATIHVPENAAFGRYEGYISFKNTNDPKETYQIPFSVHVKGLGIDAFDLSALMVTNDFTDWNPFLTGGATASFRLSTPIDKIDFVVKDGDTGDALGYIGTVDTSKTNTDVNYYVENLFEGEIYPFTDDASHPIASKKIKLQEGSYRMEAIGHAENGKTYTKEKEIYVNNTKPEMSLSLDPGIYEVDDSMYSREDGYDGDAVWVHGNIHDSMIDKLQKQGVDVTQAWNRVAWWEYNVYLYKQLYLDNDGNFRFPAMKERIDEMPLNSSVYGVNNANLGDKYPDTVKDYWFIKEGAPYGVMKFDHQSVKLDEQATMTVNVHNIKDFLSGDYNVSFSDGYLTFDDVKVNKSFRDLAKENGAEVTLDDVINENGRLKVGASVDKALNIDEDTPFLDVTFTVKRDDLYEQVGSTVHVNAMNYNTAAGSDTARVLTTEALSILPSHSQLYGYIRPEVFVKDGIVYTDKDLGKLGAKVYAIDPDGNRYDGKVEGIHFEINDLPLKYEEYEVVTEMPGHLTSKETMKLTKTIDGKRVGESTYADTPINTAGDVNGDGVIDIHDVMRAVAMYQKSDKKADLNADGIVDETDIRFIEKNFLKIGPDVTKKPLEKLGKKGINDFLKAIGLKPAKD